MIRTGFPERKSSTSFAVVLPAAFYDEPASNKPAPGCEETSPEKEDGEWWETRFDGAMGGGEGMAGESVGAD
jgi:hypothetical protein